MSAAETGTLQDSPFGAAAGPYGPGRDAVRQRILGLFDTALAFRARMSGSEWAEKYGRIPKGTGAESGPVTLYGYQRGLLDAMCDPRIPLVTVLKAARVGYTRCFTLALGYHLDHDPTLCTIAQPTIPDAEEFGGTEIAPMLRETPVLSKQIRPARKGEKPDKATFYQLANGASVRLVGAASDDAFRRYSARFPGRRRDRRRRLDAGGEEPGRQARAVLDPRRDILQSQAGPRVDATPRGDVPGLEVVAAERSAALLRALSAMLRPRRRALRLAVPPNGARRIRPSA